MYDKIREKIVSWNDNQINQIYAISLYVSDIDDDPRKPSVMLGYNTIEQWKQMVEKSSDSDEAKWNYAFWLQNCELSIGEEDDNEIITP
jgi:hypothetical protein